MRRGLLIGVVMLGLLAPSVAQARLVGLGSDSGRSPSADASGWIYSPKGALRAVVATSVSAQPVDTSVDLQCWRGNKNRHVSYKLPVLSTPMQRRISLPIKSAESCYIDVEASYHEEATEERELNPLEGEIVVEVFGNGRARQ